jgi:hypothetical protein
VIPIPAQRLHLAVANVGHDSIPFTVKANTVGSTANITVRGSFTIRADPCYLTSGITDRHGPALLDNDAFRLDNSCANGIDLVDVYLNNA